MMPSQISPVRDTNPIVKFSETADSLKAERAVSGFFDFMATLDSNISFQYMRDLYTRKSELEKRCDSLVEAHKVNAKMYTEAQDALREETQGSAKKDTELDKLKKEKSDTSKKIESLEKKLQESEKTISQLRITVKTKESVIAGLNKTVDQKKSLVTAAEAGEKKAKKDLEACQKELAAAKKDRDSKDAKLGKLRSFTSDLTTIPQDTM